MPQISLIPILQPRYNRGMSKVEAIQAEIEELTPDERASLVRWIDERFDDEWDAQIKRDAAAGKLDALMSQARRAHAEGRTRPAP